MSPSPPPPQDLSRLIDQADARITAQTAAAEAAAQRTHGNHRWKFWFTMAVWVVVGVAWAFLLWPQSLSKGEIAEELQFLLSSARSDVDALIVAEGRLPDRLPDGIYAGVVRLEPIDAQSRPPSYRLTAEVGGAIASWSSTDPQVKP